MKVQLKNFNTKQWVNDESIHVIGSAFYKGKLLDTQSLISLFISVTNVEQFSQLLIDLDGSYAVIIDRGDFKSFAVDRWASIPLLFQQSTELMIVGNDFSTSKEINEMSIDHFVCLASTPWNQTLFKNCSTLKAGELYYELPDSTWKSERYFLHKSIDKIAFSQSECLGRLDNATDQMINYLDGRRAAIPLSGGWDSTLILAELVRKDYPKILCFTYGEESDAEVKRAKAICQELNVDWQFVPYNKVVLKSILSDEWSTYDSTSHFGVSLPYDQDFFAIKYLKESKLISPKTDVLLPGYLGDHLGGSFHVFDEETIDETSVQNAVCDKFLLNDLPMIVANQLFNYFDFSSKDAVLSSYQDWLSIHRHSRFIGGGWRAMDHFGFDSYVYASQKEWVEFWYQLEWEERFKQHRYISFLQSYLKRELGPSVLEPATKVQSRLKLSLRKAVPKSALSRLKKHRRNQSNYENKLIDILDTDVKLSDLDRKDNFNVIHSQLLIKHLSE